MDTRANRVVRVIPVAGLGVGGDTISPDGERLYVSTYSGNEEDADWVTVIDTPPGQVAKTVPVGKHPFGIVLSPDGRRLYVAAQTGNDVTVIDTRNNVVAATVPLGAGTVPCLGAA